MKSPYKKAHFITNPASTIFFSFGVAIIIGAIILYLPISSHTHLRWIDALFTSTSAVCVTGLIVVDTGSFFTLFGQMVILLLIQMGGLGIITFSIIFFIMAGKSISVRDQLIVQSSFTHKWRKGAKNLIKNIFILTFVIEFVGAFLLFSEWQKTMSPLKAVYFSIFHAISAFCNAGFSLFPENLIPFKNNPFIILVFGSLIILGGLGFMALIEIPKFLKPENKIKKLSLHTKIVLITTTTLLLIGGVLFFLLEQNNVLKGMSISNKIINSIFQSITARTAGFNTVNFSQLTNATLFIFILLMFIGASPGGTGGGIKTINIAILFSLAFNRLKGRNDVVIFKRSVPAETVGRSISILIGSFIALTAILSLLLMTQQANIPHTQARGIFLELLFETTSAFGTVGLSMGSTAKLTDSGKLLIIIMMYLGRIGPLSLAAILAQKFKKKEIHYGEEDLFIG